MRYEVDHEKINAGAEEGAKVIINELKKNLLDREKIYETKRSMASQLPSALYPRKKPDGDLKHMIFEKNYEKTNKLKYFVSVKTKIKNIGEILPTTPNLDSYLKEADVLFSEFLGIINRITHQELKEIGKRINKESLGTIKKK